jgi:hypothetical protein
MKSIFLVKQGKDRHTALIVAPFATFERATRFVERKDEGKLAEAGINLWRAGSYWIEEWAVL